jgi:hypothetical protein
MKDPKNYYRLLNITPTEVFLDPERQKDVQKRLASSLMVMKHMYLPRQTAHVGGYKSVVESLEAAYYHLSSRKCLN